MEKPQSIVPFGLIFEEPVTQPPDSIQPIYDEETDLSYAEGDGGVRVPFVELGRLASTETFTKQQGEVTDSDQQALGGLAATQTITEVEAETTDTDPSEDVSRHYASMTTQTVTAVEAESNDSDVDHRASSIRWLPSMSTETATKAVETTDDD